MEALDAARHVCGLSGARLEVSEPLLLGHDGEGQVQAGLIRAALKRSSDEDRCNTGTYGALEPGRLGPEPRAFEDVTGARLTYEGVVLGEKPAPFVTCITVVAPNSSEPDLEREHRAAPRRVRPRTICRAEAGDQIGQVLRLGKAPLHPGPVATLEGIGERLDIARQRAREWGHESRRRQRRRRWG